MNCWIRVFDLEIEIGVGETTETLICLENNLTRLKYKLEMTLLATVSVLEGPT